MKTSHLTVARSTGSETLTEVTNSTRVSAEAHPMSKLYIVPWLILAIAILAILIASTTLIVKFSKQIRLVRKNSRRNKQLGSRSERSGAIELPVLESQSVQGLPSIGSDYADWSYRVDVIAGVNARSMIDVGGPFGQNRDSDQRVQGIKGND
jgi:hypothetical protein